MYTIIQSVLPIFLPRFRKKLVVITILAIYINSIIIYYRYDDVCISYSIDVAYPIARIVFLLCCMQFEVNRGRGKQT
jgi:hypothetical protein